MTVEIISRSISTKVWDRAGIELATPGSAVRLASVARHVTDCATRPGIILFRDLFSKIKGSAYGSITFELTLPTLSYASFPCRCLHVFVWWEWLGVRD